MSLPLVSLLSVFQMQVLLTAYNCYVPAFTRISWILMSGDWFMIMWKVCAKDCTWSPNFGAFFLREDKILRLGGIGSLDLGVCYFLVKDLISKSGLPGAILALKHSADISSTRIRKWLLRTDFAFVSCLKSFSGVEVAQPFRVPNLSLFPVLQWKYYD